MLGLLGMEVQLIPDGTALVQLLIFLAVVIGLSRFVFRPILSVIDERRARTDGDLAKAQEMAEDVAREEGIYKEKMEKARLEGIKVKEGLRAQGFGTASGIMEAARAESLKRIDQAKGEILNQLNQAKGILEKDAHYFAKLITAKIMERKGNGPEKETEYGDRAHDAADDV